ncbi:MAG TPA: ABC transporter ATP-binding protein [Ktedonobacterales bacterium]|jgi:iron complex transport system ATP-binding protein|nr:ABC transporter ATP-binding protein [Ktedonobacterales bacterium]
MTNPALEFDSVSFAYHRARALEGVSFHVAPGEMVGLLGPNGAGKSTILKLAAGTLRPQAGRVCLLGDEASRLPRREAARRVAVVPQEFTVQFPYTVRQIVEMGRTPRLNLLGALDAGDHAVVDSALATTNITHLADRVLNELSGGERQRVLLALALAQEGHMLLLDEPTAHLDIRWQIETLELLRRLNAERGLTILAALHDLNLAARYFSRLILLNKRVVADGPPSRALERELLGAVYGAAVTVGVLGGEEHLSVLPPGHTWKGASTSVDGASPPPQVHALAGGGTGALALRALADAGIPFSAGPLNVGDSDYALAERLAVSCIVEPPYAPLSEAGLATAGAAMRAAGTVLICPIPLGAGNAGLLDAALAAAQSGARLILLEPEMGDASDRETLLTRVGTRDYSGRGPDLYRALLDAGAQVATSPTRAIDLLMSAGRASS